MGIDFFWKRVPASVIADCGPKELAGLVPYFYDSQYMVERENGTLVAGDTGALIDVLFRAAASSAEEKAAVRAYAQAPADWDEDYMVGTLGPDLVRQMAAFLSDAPFEQWMQEHRGALIDALQEWGSPRPFDDAWAGHVLENARELAALFRAAALADETIIVQISA
jgi:hypothetical protein